MTAKVTFMYTRQLKVAYKWRPTCHNIAFRKESPVPFINLSGNWLEEAGFLIGDKVTVSVESNRLTIVKIDVEDEAVKQK
jgi:hypothetical protein